MKKTCSRCGTAKPLDQFGAKSSAKDGLDYWCRNCKEGDKLRYLTSKGMKVNETRFNSVVNGLNSIARKVFDVVPIESYWGVSRIQQELFRTGSNQTKSIVEGSLKALVGNGLIIESNGLFSRVKITKREQKAVPDKKTIQKEEKIMETVKSNPFDAVREIAIKFMDAAKQINNLATEIDARLTDVEKHIAENDLDTAKLKQLQSILKSLG